MDFQTSVKTCFRKYADFNGRATRPEYWYFVLFLFIANLVLALLDGAIFGFGENAVGLLSPLFSLATLLPSLAVGARRLHDIGRSGWWLLLALIPLIGFIILLVWFCTRSEEGPNEHGPAAQPAMA